MHNASASPIGGRNGNAERVGSLQSQAQNGTANTQKEVAQSGDLASICAQVHAKVEKFLNRKAENERLRRTQEQTRESLGVIGEALEKYSPSALSLSYNGGKDCLVLLILYLSALHTYATNPSTPNSNRTLPPSLQSIYIIPPDPFPEVDEFVKRTSEQYHLSLHRSTQPMKAAFASYLETQPNIRAIFVGTRRTDPHGAQLTHFDATDGGWPAFMRVHPVIDWNYPDIWTFIRGVGVEYCILYDLGYTSLGGVGDTLPNPALRRDGEVANGTKKEDADSYRPAYELVEDDEERLGRDR
ncbi:putative phosphoadenosine phosphosulfate reductase, rossmann-like alpha/beta/alpha sandwich [Acrodontium crateriforme]|uniref:FAD synthase n=1 Tax=Acrodontium crateriforme TaxID=150365 RepID=A0AAQ3MBL5_9PEZI|nr:putative phosphoadenosine phosphosulfate reductase, rossmann-like alpha/beta/alpha sandwich [Acrodontium crateriforme]